MAANSEPEAQLHMVSRAQGEGQFELRYHQSKVEEANHVAWYQEACSCSQVTLKRTNTAGPKTKATISSRIKDKTEQLHKSTNEKKFS